MNKLSTKSTAIDKIGFYLDRAAQCALEAGAASLQNVRDRSLRSEAAWRQMAALVAVPETAMAEPLPAQRMSQSTPLFSSFR